MGLHQGRAEGEDHFPQLLAMLFVTYPGIPLAFLASRSRCWLMANLWPTRAPKSFCAELLSYQVSP